MMRLVILFGCSLLAMSSLSQVKFKHLSLKKAEKLDYEEHDIFNPSCSTSNENGGIVLFELAGVDPAESDENKQVFIEMLDKQLLALKAYAECPNVHTIIIKLSEAPFLKEADGFEVHSKRFYRKGYKLNAERFKSRYLDQLNLWLSGKTIILTDWNW